MHPPSPLKVCSVSYQKPSQRRPHAATFTLGIEEEYQTIDPETRDLRSHVATEMLARGKIRPRRARQAELHQSRHRGRHAHLPRHQGSHRRSLRPPPQHDPPCRRNASSSSPEPPTLRRLARPGDLPRPPIRSGRRGSPARRARKPHLRPPRPRRHRGQGSRHPRHELHALLPPAHPCALHQLALLAGHGDRLQKLPGKDLRELPRTNLPDTFNSYSEFENYVNLLIKTNCIDNAKKIWWDIRPHPTSTPSRCASATSPCARTRPSRSPP